MKFLFTDISGLSPSGNDGLRMHSLMDKFLSFSQQLTSQDGNSGSSITDLLILSFGDFDKDFSSWIIDMHRSENGGTIIGYSDGFVLGARCNRDKDFVHTSGAKSSFDEISNSNGTNK